MRKPALKALKDYQAQRKQGLDPQFDAQKLGIAHAEEWSAPAAVNKPVQKVEAEY